jgi:hypothetical protein
MRKLFDTNTLQLLLGLVALMFVVTLLGQNAYAATRPINCQTAFGEKVFTIENNTIAFHQEQAGRGISSITNARSQKTFQGFRKTLYIDGNKHLININNTSKFTDADDFLAVTSPKGHKMTYPLTCNFVR